jgi:hypothetical protein
MIVLHLCLLRLIKRNIFIFGSRGSGIRSRGRRRFFWRHVRRRLSTISWSWLNCIELTFFTAAWSLIFFIINNHVYGFHHILCPFIENPVGTTVCGVSQEYTFITLGIKLPKILPVMKDRAFTSKSFEVLYSGFLTSPNFIGSLVCFRPQVYFVDNVACSVNYFSPEVLSKIPSVDHHTSHLLNNPVLSFNNSILLRSDRRRKFWLDFV